MNRPGIAGGDSRVYAHALRLTNARRAGRGVVDEIWPLGIEVLNRAGRSQDAKALDLKVKAMDARWDLESFSEKYEALRRMMPPGDDRTRRMTALLLVPHRLAQTHEWTRDAIRLAWSSDEDGKRLFALGLMQGDPRLVGRACARGRHTRIP